MKTKTEKILTGLKILAWLAMIGYSIECGSQAISFGLSFINPAIAKNVCKARQEFFNLLKHSQWFFIYAMSFVIALSMMKVRIWYLVIELFSKLNLKTPFSMEVAKKLEKIVYQLFGIWVVSIFARSCIKWLSKSTGEPLIGISIADEFLFIAGIVYIISQIFKRGIEIQEENQLTV